MKTCVQTKLLEVQPYFPYQSLFILKTRLSHQIPGMIHSGDILKQSNESYKTKGETAFHIPDEKWFLKNGCINSPSKGPSFIKKLDIFLPPLNKKYKFIVERGATSLNNKLGNVSYIFTKVIYVSCNYYENHGHILNCKDPLTRYYNDNCQGKIKSI